MGAMALITLVATAQAAQVSLAADTEEVREGQSIGLSLTVTDANPQGVPAITAPEGVRVEYRSQAQSQMMINFHMTRSVTFRYALAALREGTWTIPPVRVATTAGVLTTGPLTIRVAARGEDGVEDIVATLGAESAWVGQVLVYHARFTTAEQRLNGRWQPPEVAGLTAEPGIEPITPDYQVQDGARTLSVIELLYPFRASKAGTFTVPGAVLQAQMPVQRQRTRRNDRLGGLFDELNAFTEMSTEVYSAKPLPLTVRPLPTEGRPASFSGLVGQFQIRATPSASTVKVGDTVTLAVDIEGDGPLSGVTLPPFTAAGLRAYDDQPVVEAKLADGKVTAHASLKRALVPQVGGDVVIPPVELAYFDPVAGAYAVAATEPVTLHVTGDAGSAQVASFAGETRHAVDALAEDILPVRTDVRLAPPWPGGWAWALLAPGAGALGWQALSTWRPRRRAAERRYDFDDLPAEPEARLAGLERIFRERVGAQLGMAPEALHGEDLVRLGALAPEAEAVYRTLERLRYGGIHGELPEAELRGLVAALTGGGPA